MKKSYSTTEQIVFALRQAESGTPVAEVCRKIGIIEQTFYRWKKKYLGMGVAEVRRLKILEEENRKLKQLVDNYTRESLAIEVAWRLGEHGVVATLMEVVQDKGKPKSIRMDNGSEFTSKVLDQWAYLNGVELDFIRPGRSTDNALIEVFNGRFRVEYLNESWFLSLEDAREKVEEWRQHYNRERPHGSFGNVPPLEFAGGLVSKLSGKSLMIDLKIDR
jgi:putative transposase